MGNSGSQRSERHADHPFQLLPKLRIAGLLPHFPQYTFLWCSDTRGTSPKV